MPLLAPRVWDGSSDNSPGLIIGGGLDTMVTWLAVRAGYELSLAAGGRKHRTLREVGFGSSQLVKFVLS